MSVAAALRAARDARIGLHVDGADLVLEATAPPPAAVLDLLTRHKADLIMLLEVGDDGWSADDWRALYDERAGIVEFDGGLPRPEAEALAFKCCVVEWLNRNFERSPRGSCRACGGGDSAQDALQPHGVEPTGHVWLHSRCWPAWHSGRKADAVVVLKAMGIQDGSTEI